jgi:DNA topoisomerase II
MVLVNGAEGIATGYSTFIPQYNPFDIVEALKEKMKGQSFSRLHPYYKGFNGVMRENGEDSYICEGTYHMKENTDEPILVIDELPIYKWTKDYKQFLETLIDEGVIEDMREYHSHNRVRFELLIPRIDLIE